MKARLTKPLLTLSIVLATLSSWHANPLMAAVPPSVAIRQQPAAVEDVIKQLETKAAAAVGTWQTRSGRQDAPSEEWATGIGGDKTWYWSSLAPAPSASQGITVYFDGEDGFLLAYGKDQKQGDFHFQFDSLLRGRVIDHHRLSHYLIQMNLLPRQFIGSLGGLSVIGNETLDGQQVIHLRSSPADDATLKNDVAFKSPPKQPHHPLPPSIDLYFDVQKGSITKFTILENGLQSESKVTAWDAFGTNGQWPSQTVGRVVFVKPIVQPGADFPTLGKPILTTVEKFTPGKDPTLAAVAKKVSDQQVFSTRTEDLWSSDFYGQSLKVKDNPNERVALAISTVLRKDVTESLRQWDIVDAQMTAPEAHNRLAKAMAPASYVMEEAAQEAAQRSACVSLLQRFLGRVPDGDFRGVADGALLAWDQLRRVPEAQQAVQPMTALLLTKLAQTGNVFVLERLVRFCQQSKDDAALIEPYLKAVANNQVPATGFLDSQQQYLMLAAIRADDFDRAQQYLAALQWPDTIPADQRAVAGQWSQALQIVQQYQKDPDSNLATAIAAHHGFAQIPQAQGTVDRAYGKWMLAKMAAVSLITRLDQNNKPKPDAWLQQTAQIAGAAEFWDQAFKLAAPELVLKPKKLMTGLGPILHNYSVTFGKKDYEYEMWLQTLRRPEVRGKFLGVEVQYANKALASASDDNKRGRAISELGSIYARVGEYAKGAQAVQAASGIVQDEKIKQTLGKLANALQTHVPPAEIKPVDFPAAPATPGTPPAGAPGG